MSQIVAIIGNSENEKTIAVTNENCVDEKSTLKELKKLGLEVDEHGHSFYSETKKCVFYVRDLISVKKIEEVQL